MTYNRADQRYPPYRLAAERADRVAYITANHPALDAVLRDYFDGQTVTYREQQIGPFTVFYDFDPPHPRPPDWSTGDRVVR
jgi:hypothetical protein